MIDERASMIGNASLDASPRHVLVSSASGKIPLIRAVINAARKVHPVTRVFAGDLDATALGRYVADEFLVLPRTEDTNLETIRNLCLRHGIGVIIPTRDGELDFWARYAGHFAAADIEVIVSSPEAIALSLDKLRFAAHGEKNHLPIIPAWRQPQGSGPFVVKERYGAGSRSIGLNLAPSAALDHAAQLADPIVQPFVQGEEISVDAWIDRKHRVKGLVMRTRDQVRNGESVVTTTFRDDLLETACREVLESMPLRGPVVLQLIRDTQGRPHVIELNARFGGASTTAIAAGLDIWFWCLLEANGGDAEAQPFHRIPGEVRQVRVPADIYVHDPHF